jgi:microcystin degradation protein MlrC
MRIAIAGFMHESNTFNPLCADRAAFAQQGFAVGADLLGEWRDAHHEVGGFLEAGPAEGFEPIPLLMAWATPSGPVTRDAFDEITGLLLDRLTREKPDGLLLALHGAMVSSDHLDADGEILARIRAAVGRDFPLAVTLDLHGNLSPRLAGLCDLAVAYRTNPHVDQRDCGRRAARLLVRWLRKEIRPRLALAKPPLLINILKQDTAREPLAAFMRRTRALEDRPGILSASLLPGFAYADVPQMGPSILAVADDEADLARAEADALANALWEEREQFRTHLPDARQAVARALEAQRTPVVLVDSGDNVGGGSAGDGTVVLAELLRQGATGAVVCLYAPEEVRACRAAGLGAAVTLHVGGKVDRLHGEAVTVSGTVGLLHDGTYVETAVRHGGKRVNHMGPAARLDLHGGNRLVLTSLRHPPFSLGALTCMGIHPQEQRILVVKAAIAYKAAYGPIAGTVIEASTPGLATPDPARLPYRHVRRPLWPLDEPPG